MNSFEIKAFLSNYKKFNILNIFNVTYKMNPQFNDFAIFLLHNDCLIAFVISSNNNNFKDPKLSFEDKCKFIDKELEYSIDKFFNMSANTKSKPGKVDSFISPRLIHYLNQTICLCSDIGIIKSGHFNVHNWIINEAPKHYFNNNSQFHIYNKGLENFGISLNSDTYNMIKSIKNNQLIL